MGHSTETTTPTEPEVGDADEGEAGKVAQSIRTTGAKLFGNKTAYQRLHTELATAESELEELIDRVGATDESWAVRSRRLLERAQDALDRGNLDVGWRYLHTAQRFEIYGLETLAHRQERAAGEPGDTDTGSRSTRRSELELRAATIREEALDTLDGWRRRAVVDLICDESEALKSDPTGAAVRRASKLLHEQYESTYRKRSERQRQFNQLVVMATASGLFLFVYTLAETVWAAPANGTGLLAAFLVTPFGIDCASMSACADITKPGFAVFMTAMGVMGAALFGMRSLRRRSLSTEVPQQIDQLTVTGARGVIGAISALLLYFALQTDPVVSGTIVAEGVVSPSLMAVVGFAAGYSERMAPNVVATVASLTDTDGGEANTKS